MKISGSITLVTGGASGLGFAVAQRFLQGGAKVAIVDLPHDKNAEKLAKELPGAFFAPADITQSDQLEEAIASVQESLGNIQVGINCAGIAFAEKTLNKGVPASLETFKKTILVNLVGTYNACRLMAQSMADNTPDAENSRGIIINTASIAASDGQKGQSAYAASKGGVASLTLPLARDLSSYGIRVVTIAPGIFDTPMFDQLPEKAKTQLAEKVPFPQRLGKPIEFAALAEHCVENSMLNGEIIRLDGGLRM